MKQLGYFLFYVFGSISTLSANAALKPSSSVQDISFKSVLLSGDSKAKETWVTYRAVFPPNYDQSRSYPIVYFLHGRSYGREMISEVNGPQALADLVNRGEIQPLVIIAPEAKGKYWVNGAETHERWADVVTSELIKDVEKRIKTCGHSKCRLISGISMGGHGALQIALNFPGIYGAVGAHSPILRTYENAIKDFRPQFGTIEDYQVRDPFSLLHSGKRFGVPVWIDIGYWDYGYKRAAEFTRLLEKQGTNGHFEIGEAIFGAHTVRYWRSHFKDYLRWYSHHLTVVPE